MKAIIFEKYGTLEVPDVIAYVKEGHARGKVVIAVNEQEGDSE